MEYFYKKELFHHGIKGQKWGVRNGPPYPIDRSKKANKVMQKIAGNRTGYLDPELIGLGIRIVLPILTIAARIAIANKKYKNEIEDNTNNNDTNIQKRIKGKHTEEQDMMNVNSEGYASEKPEFRMNCTMCTAAYELRRRGYDVRANTSTQGRRDADYMRWFNVTKQEAPVIRNYNEFVKEINKQPEGARGNISCGVGAFNSNHSMVWEKKEGKIIIRDCQTNKVYSNISTSIIRKDSGSGYLFYRTDNREINWDSIRDAVVEN